MGAFTGPGLYGGAGAGPRSNRFAGMINPGVRQGPELPSALPNALSDAQRVGAFNMGAPTDGGAMPVMPTADGGVNIQQAMQAMPSPYFHPAGAAIRGGGPPVSPMGGPSDPFGYLSHMRVGRAPAPAPAPMPAAASPLGRPVNMGGGQGGRQLGQGQWDALYGGSPSPLAAAPAAPAAQPPGAQYQSAMGARPRMNNQLIGNSPRAEMGPSFNSSY